MSSSRSLVMAIDQGTTGTTALLIDARGGVRARGYAELPQHFPRPGWVEHDGEEIWASVQRAAVTALKGVVRREIAAIGITNQRETTLIWDRKTGRPIAPAIVWQDRRTAERCQDLRKQGLGPAVKRRTGLVLDPYFSATKVDWLLRRTPGAQAAARAGRLAFGTVDSWLVWKLTGGKVHATDPTNASRTMLYDIGRQRWDDGLLDTFGVPKTILPEVLPSSGGVGTTSGEGAIPRGIAVAGIAGDQQAALFGQGCVAPGQSKNTYGTGCFLLRHTGTRRVLSRAGLLTTVACGPKGEPAYALEGSVFIAGAAMQWLRDGLRILDNVAAAEAIAESVEDTGGVTLVPAFVGLGAPHWRPDARGAIFGLTRGTTRAHVIRAALESLALQSRDLLAAMEKDAGTRLRELRVDGGAAANGFLMQYQADVLGIPVLRPRVIEITALGAGLLAGLGAGVWESQEDLDRARQVQRVFRPQRSKAWRDAEHARWTRAVGGVLAIAGGSWRSSRSSPARGRRVPRR
jgi:glycerol kinase